MSRFLLDTSAYSALLRGHVEVAGLARSADELIVTPIVLGELKAGFRRGSRRQSNEGQLLQFLSSPRVRVLAIDEDTSDRYAVIFDGLRTAGRPIGVNDLWIAASAMQHGLPVVTTDPDFKHVSQIIVQWFEP